MKAETIDCKLGEHLEDEDGEIVKSVSAPHH
jgi:hypothetical protein